MESLFLDLQRYCAAEAADSAGLGARLLSFAAFAPMLSLGIGVAMMGQR